MMILSIATGTVLLSFWAKRTVPLAYGFISHAVLWYNEFLCVNQKCR